jgi:hypothetical protein
MQGECQSRLSPPNIGCNPLAGLYFYQTLGLEQSQMSSQADFRLPN